MTENGRTAIPTIQFGKYKGRSIKEVPLSYLRWWKSQLIDNLRDCGAEIERRQEMGLTEEIETKLSVLPLYVRDNLIQQLERAQFEDDRTHALWLIEVKYREYSGHEPAIPRATPAYDDPNPDDEGFDD